MLLTTTIHLISLNFISRDYRSTSVALNNKNRRLFKIIQVDIYDTDNGSIFNTSLTGYNIRLLELQSKTV